MPEAPLTPENLTEQQLKFGYWFVTHKLLLKRIAIAVLLAIDAALIGFGGYGLVNIYLLQADADRRFEEELVSVGQSSAAHQRNLVRPLEVGGTQVLAAGAKYDFVASVRNPNPRHEAVFTYRFAAGDEATEPQTGFAFPGEERVVVSLGAVLATRPAGAELVLTEVSWRRVDRHEVPDHERFVAEHLNFEITQVNYDPSFEVNGKFIGKTTFNVRNNTGFGYHRVRMVVYMYRGPALAGVNAITLSDFRPGETRMSEVSWVEPLPAISSVRVVPEVDIFDDGVYLRR